MNKMEPPRDVEPINLPIIELTGAVRYGMNVNHDRQWFDTVPWQHVDRCIDGTIGHFTLAALIRTIVLVSYRQVKSLQLIWRSGTRRWHLRVPDLQVSCSDLIEIQDTRAVVPVMTNRKIFPTETCGDESSKLYSLYGSCFGEDHTHRINGFRVGIFTITTDMTNLVWNLASMSIYPHNYRIVRRFHWVFTSPLSILHAMLSVMWSNLQSLAIFRCGVKTQFPYI